MSGRSEKKRVTLQMIFRQMVTLDSRVNTTNERLERFERTTNERFDSLERRFDTRFAAVEGQLELHGRVIGKLVDEVSKLNTRFDDFLVGAHGEEHDDLRARVERLEKRTGRR